MDHEIRPITSQEAESRWLEIRDQIAAATEDMCRQELAKLVDDAVAMRKLIDPQRLVELELQHREP